MSLIAFTPIIFVHFSSFFIVTGIGLMFDFYMHVLAAETVSRKWRKLIKNDRLDLQRIDDTIQPIIKCVGASFYLFALSTLALYEKKVKEHEMFVISLMFRNYGLSTRGMNILAKVDRGISDFCFRQIRARVYANADNRLRFSSFSILLILS